LTVALSTLGTLVVIMVILNFRNPENEPHHRVKRFYDIKSPQLKRQANPWLAGCLRLDHIDSDARQAL